MDVEQGMGADGLGPSSAPHVQQMEQFKEEMSREPPPYEPGFAPHAAPGLAGVVPNQPGPASWQVQALSKEPCRRNCLSCHSMVTSRVSDSMKSSGWAWCILCCLCGSWIAGLLACCMEGFKEYRHTCPKCNAMLGIYEGETTKCQIAILVVATVISVGLVAFIIFAKLQR